MDVAFGFLFVSVYVLKGCKEKCGQGKKLELWKGVCGRGRTANSQGVMAWRIHMD